MRMDRSMQEDPNSAQEMIEKIQKSLLMATQILLQSIQK